VALAEKSGKALNQLTLDQFKSIDPNFSADVLSIFQLRNALARREITGAPSARQVARQLARWKKSLQPK
jgi:argininosuccinate lyase